MNFKRTQISFLSKGLFFFLVFGLVCGYAKAQGIDDNSLVKERNLNNVFKLNLCSSALGFTQITYERNVYDNRNIELGLGIIGLGYDAFRVDAKGFNLRAGYKFMFNKNSSNKFKGWYLKPEIFFATYTKLFDTVPFLSGLEFNFIKKSSSEDDDPIFYKRMTTFSALANIGYQWVFWKRLTLDVNFGLGVNICSPVTNQDDFFNFSIGYMYGVFTDDRKAIAPAASGSLRIGFVF
ncbi:MAG: hypothetical protein ACK5MH_02940 [Bacteroidales bacterium]